MSEAAEHIHLRAMTSEDWDRINTDFNEALFVASAEGLQSAWIDSKPNRSNPYTGEKRRIWNKLYGELSCDSIKRRKEAVQAAFLRSLEYFCECLWAAAQLIAFFFLVFLSIVGLIVWACE